MHDYACEFTIQADVESVYQAISEPDGLAVWWPKTASGYAKAGQMYDFHFGPGYDWKAEVVECKSNELIEWIFKKSDPDWLGSKVRIQIEPQEQISRVQFRHSGWAQANQHYHISCYCWPMYLRHLKRWVEHGERVDYELRLEV